MKISRRIIIISVLIGILTVFGLNTYLKNVEVRVASSVPKVEYSQVVVAVSNINENTKITEEMIALKSIPNEAIHPDTITNVEEIVGGITKVDLVGGEQVLGTKVITDVEKAELAYRIPEKMRAMTIPTSEVMGVAGYINTGDHIDILVTYSNKNNNSKLEENETATVTTYTQFQNIEVLADGSSIMTEEEKKSTLPGSITILVKPEEAEVLAYALLNGTMHFTLRNPTDSEKINSEFYNSTNFESYKER